jgi:hypothetical protein
MDHELEIDVNGEWLCYAENKLEVHYRPFSSSNLIRSDYPWSQLIFLAFLSGKVRALETFENYCV